jgi:Glycosyltransferase
MSRLAIQFSRALKRWDRNAAARAATYVANSRNTATRIRRAYGLTAHVLPPPPGVTPDGPQTPVLEVAGDYFLTVGRPRGYKNTQALIAAFEAYGRERLVVVGGPPDRQTQTSFAGITFLEDVTDGQLRWLYANCLGLLAMGREDFGLTPVEAAGFGKPTLALAAGGYLETVLPGRTGVLIDEASPHAIQGGLEAIMRTSWSTAEIEHHGKSFSAEHFCQELKTICERAIVEP